MKIFLFAAALFFQLTSHAQYQVLKGHWVISHQIGGYSYTKNQYKEYEEGNLRDQATYKYHDFNLAFSGPSWGGMEFLSEKFIPDGGNETKRRIGGIYLSPEIGYFMRDNLMIGANVVMGFKTLKYEPTSYQHGKGHDWTLGLGPMMKYYFGKNAKRKPFAGFESRLEFGKGKEKGVYLSDRSEADLKRSSIVITPYAGYAWFLGKRWTADARVEYTYVKETANRTEWYYEGGVLSSYSPLTDKREETFNVIALSFGISYTF